MLVLCEVSLTSVFLILAWMSLEVITPSSGFFEVGVSSYLRDTVQHLPESGWLLLRPWDATTAGMGFFEASAPGSEAFSDRFIVPEPGIYYVAVNLRMADVYCGFLKASVVVNSEFDEHNGLSGIFGNTTATDTISVTGLLHLFVKDELAVYLHGSGGKVLSRSTFSVVRVSSYSSVPGFHAALQRTQMVQPQGWTRLENWQTSVTKGRFQTHTGFSPSVGQFCAILEGVYLFTANINIESSQHATTYVLAFVLNSVLALMERHISSTENCTCGLSSLFFLHRGSCVELRIRQTSQGSLTALFGSGFSGIFLGFKNEFPQFSASLGRPNQEIKPSGWNLLSGWTENSSRGNFQSDETSLKENSSIFESRESRLFIITATVNVNVSLSGGKDPIYLLISINGAPSGLTGNSGLFAGRTLNLGPQSLSVSGVVLLNKGDTVAVYIYKGDNTPVLIDGQFGVSMVSYDWPGVAATLKENVPLTSSEWTAVTSWVAHTTTGLFSFDNAFSPASGKYRANLDGVYFVSCNAVFEGSGDGALSVLIAIDDVLDPGRGVYSYHGNPKHDVTINVAGSIKISRGQNVAIFVRATDVSSWTVSSETGFSLVLIGAESFSATGFFAKKQKNTNFTSSSWEEIGGWSPPEDEVEPFFEAGGQFNSTSGQFKAMEDGLYLVSANILLSHNGSTPFTITMARDGKKKSAIQYFQQQPSSPPNGDTVNTLTLAGVMHLGAGQHVSIFIKPDSAVSWNVLTNSSFSVVMVARWQSANAAGLLAFKYGRSTFTGVAQQPYWTTEPEPEFENPFDKALTTTRDIRVRIPHSGLYFAQTVVSVKDMVGNVTFRCGLCVNREFLPNGVTASKKSDGSIRKDFSISAFGVLYLRKGDEVFICTDSSSGQSYIVKSGGGFSMVRFLPLAVSPGLHQHAPALLGDSRNSSQSSLGTWFVIRSWSSGGDRFYINNDIFNPNPILSSDKGVFSAPISGWYFISAMMVLKTDVPTHVLTCVGPHNCTTCYIRFSKVAAKGSDSISFVGLADLRKDEAISVCINSSVSYERASRSVQFLSNVNANTTIVRTHERVDFNSSGWHKLEEWKSSDGAGTASGDIVISNNGLYIVSINQALKAPLERGIVGVRLEVTGPASSRHEIVSVSSSTGTDGWLSLSVAVLDRLASSEDVIVSAFTNSSSLSISGNATFFAALVSNATQFSCFSVRCRRQSSYKSYGLWTPIAPWQKVELQCESPLSDDSRGRFVADVAGVYFVSAVVVVQTFGSLLEERTIELLLSINGDVEESNSLKASRTLKDGLSTVLSLSSSIYLDQWQTVYLMVRSDGAGIFDVGNGSTFNIALMDKKRFYKRMATNLSRVDNGPQIVRHPPPSVRLGRDLGSNVSWICDAVAGDRVTYKWLKDDQHISSSQDLVLRNVGASHSGRYVCVAESDNIGVTSRASELEVFDTKPQFEKYTYKVEVSENGNVSLELPFTAVNPQGISSNVSVRITKGNTNDTFEVSPSVSSRHSFLKSTHSLDYEEVNLYALTLEATNLETKKNATVNVTVAVTDVNDNAPEFSNSYYKISLWENVTIGAVVFRADATDKDSANYSMISYSFVSGEDDGAFSINSKSGNVTTKAPLDRETMDDVTLCIQATDGKYVAVAKLLITILDVNEFVPVFFPLNYTRRVSESVLPGEPVVQLFAADRDAQENRRIVYNITSGNADAMFDIDQHNGTIFLRKPLDYERRKSYELRVKASDGKFSSPEFANVVIDVVDNNDNNPVFEQPMYSFSAPENATVSSLVGRVNARDNDSFENGAITYSLSVVGDYEKFKINSSTGEILTAETLDFEKARNYFILVEASDGGHPARMAATLVNISTSDVNDQSPECRPCDYTASITEATTVGTPVVRVFFEDRDSMPHSEILYTISGGNVNNTFNITEEGAIILHKQLDRESVPMYHLSVDATNKGGSAPTSREPAIVHITITDANDNYPEFSASSYSTTVSEDVQPGSSIMEVKAYDRDSGLNSYVTYSFADIPCCAIARELFSINSTSGCITTRTKLKWSRSLSEYQFQVKASDHGIPTLVSNANVSVSVEDVNDSPPVFTQRVYEKAFECPPDPDTVLVRVTFTDADSGSNANYTPDIKTVNSSSETCNHVFTITPDGNISSRIKLQDDCTYYLDVSANDSAGMDTCTVVISVAERLPAESNTNKQSGFIPKEGEILLLILVIILFLLLVVILFAFVLKRTRIRGYCVTKDFPSSGMELQDGVAVHKG